MRRWLLIPVLLVAISLVAVSEAGVDLFAWVDDICTPYFREQYEQSSAPTNVDHFKAELAGARADLEHGNSTLRDSCRRVEKAATEFFPSYLNMIELIVEGKDREEKIARNLVQSLREAAPDASHSRIERELDDIVAH